MKGLLVLLGLALAPAQGQQGPSDDPRRELARVEVEERNVLGEITDIDQQLYDIEREIRQLRDRSDEFEAQRRLNEDELIRAEAALNERADQTRRMARQLYRLNRRGFARVIFSAEDPADLRRLSRYLIAVVQGAEFAAHRYREQVTIKEAAVNQVESDRAGLAALQAELRLKEAQLRDDRARRTTLLNEVRDRRSLALRVLAERSNSAETFTARLAQREAPKASSGGGDAEFRALHGRMSWPVSGGTLMRGFGTYTDAQTNTPANNLGVDISAARHTPIRAVAAGTVESVSFVNAYGLTLVVSHGSYMTVYAHCGDVRVRQGQKVDLGDVIGTIGETGLTDTLGPRLHFEVRYHNRPQDPLSWLSRRG